MNKLPDYSDILWQNKKKKGILILCSNLSLKNNAGVPIYNVHMIHSTIHLFFVDPF